MTGRRQEADSGCGNVDVKLGGGYLRAITEKFHGAVHLRFKFSTVFIFNKKVYQKVP